MGHPAHATDCEKRINLHYAKKKKRRLDAISRNIARLELELERIQKLKKQGEPAVLAFPEKIDEYVKQLKTKLAGYREKQ